MDGSFLTRLLRLRLWVTERLRPTEAMVTLFWAGLVGALGGLSAPAFQAATGLVQRLFTGHGGSLVETARALEGWQRVLVPTAGGLAAGLVLTFGPRLVKKGSKSVDYMEAVVLGDGVIQTRPTIVRTLSSMFSIGSGGSLGREGPMVQLAAMAASLVGRFAEFPRPRLRLLVACGAAAGIASAYNAPFGGALFVAEIVLGTIAMESLGPLIFASVLATIVARMFQGGKPLFAVPDFTLVSYVEIVPYLFVGLFAGALAPWFLKLLRASASWFGALPLPLYARMTLGGLVAGFLSLRVPDVWGNGYDAVEVILSSSVLWQALVALLVFKVAATAATIGSGAVGGIFTPTLLVGAVIGGLVGHGVNAIWPESSAPPSAYALVGSGAFLAGTTHAPLMAMLMLYDMTLSYEIVLPLMLACVAAYTAARAVSPESLYAEIKKTREEQMPKDLDEASVRSLMKADPVCVRDNARFPEVVQAFVGNRHHNLYVVTEDRVFRGVIPLHDIKPFLNDPELGRLAIAQDLLKEEFPVVTPDTSLRETLRRFATHPFERMPVVDAHETRRLVGVISKTDLLLAMGAQRG